MQPQTVIEILSALAQAAKTLAPEVERAIQVLTSDDGDQIKAALAALQAAGDDLHDRVHAKLATAEG
jgi:hypothetical protein